jgi:hypothetical protein
MRLAEMPRRIEFEIEGARALAVLHDDLTPKACDAIWAKLPLEGMTIMAKWACREIMLHLTGDMYLELEQEGPRALYTAPGDIRYFLRGPSLLGSQKEYIPEFQRSLCELAIYYGKPTPSPYDPGRRMDENRWELRPTIPRTVVSFAHFKLPLSKDFYLKCEEIRHGRKKLTIRRYSEKEK